MKDVARKIESIRKKMGRKLLVLGHHYQRATVLSHADERGDSLELARKAAANVDAERIVFCGVKFMAESADILSGPNQTVYMPELAAGCPMADMVSAEAMEAAMGVLNGYGAEWVPIVYVNSSAAVKACCGRWGGSTCTSSNAVRVFQWAFAQGKRILFLPDEHLGANTAHDLGISDSLVETYDPRQDGGGLSREQVDGVKVIGWKGFCIVHQAFTLDRISEVRRLLPDAKIIVHPESPKEVVRVSDAHGSTAQIIRYVEGAEDGATIVIGTELNLVQRLAEEQRGRVTVKALAPSVCANMAKTNEANLLEVLEHWPTEREIHVPEDIARDARMALQRMLEM